MMALLKILELLGITMCIPTLAEPADSPNNVTLRRRRPSKNSLAHRGVCLYSRMFTQLETFLLLYAVRANTRKKDNLPILGVKIPWERTHIHLLGITTKGLDVFLHPFQSQLLVFETLIACLKPSKLSSWPNICVSAEIQNYDT